MRYNLEVAPSRYQKLHQKLHRRSRGGLSVEMAIVAPVLITLLFGMIEMGLMMKDAMVVNSACREAARSAALGATTTQITAAARSAAPTLALPALTLTQQYRTASGDVWGPWTALTDDAALTANAAPTCSQVRIAAAYQHHLVTGSLFASLATPGTSIIKLQGCVIMLRE